MKIVYSVVNQPYDWQVNYLLKRIRIYRNQFNAAVNPSAVKSSQPKDLWHRSTRIGEPPLLYALYFFYFWPDIQSAVKELMQSDMAGPCLDHKKKDPPSWALIHLTGKPAVPRSLFDLFRSREGREVLGRRLLQFSCLRTLPVWSLGFLLTNCIGWNLAVGWGGQFNWPEVWLLQDKDVAHFAMTI